MQEGGRKEDDVGMTISRGNAKNKVNVETRSEHGCRQEGEDTYLWDCGSNGGLWTNIAEKDGDVVRAGLYELDPERWRVHKRLHTLHACQSCHRPA